MLVNPMMIAGVGGAAVPLALHLLSRAQYRRVEWGAMMFLQEEQFNELRSAQVKRWTLLVLRMAAVGLLALALARPVIQAKSHTAARTLSVIVVDCSGSMSYDEGGRTRMDLARGAVLQILSRLKRPDQAALIVSGERAASGQAARFSGDFESLAARVADLEAGSGLANLSEAITSALNLLDRENTGAGGTRCELYVVCDRQAASWAGVTDSFIAAWKDRLAKTTRLDRFVVVPVGGDGSANIAVESVAPAALPMIRGIGNRLEVTLRNYGPQPRTSVAVSVTTSGGPAGKQLMTATVNLPERATATAGQDVILTAAGPQVVTATVKGRGIAGDDRLDAVLNVRQPIRVLIGSGAGGVMDDASRYVRAALCPYKSAGREGVDPAAVDVESMASLASANLADYELIVLADVVSLDAPTAQKLERFVSGGGGLLVSVGERTQPEALNAALFRGGAGALPAELGDAEEEALEAGLEIDAQDHPVFRSLTPLNQDASAGAVKRYLAASPSSASRVLARMGSGEPLLVERSLGRGKVLLLTTSLTTQWGKLAATSQYVPLVQSMAAYLATAGADEHNLRVGEEIIATLAQPPAGRVTMTLPDGTNAPCDVVTLNEQTQARFAQTQRPGIYRMRIGPLVIPFAVRASSEESDLTPLSENRWERLGVSLGFARVDRPEQAAPAAEASMGYSLWLGLILSVMMVLIVEMGLTRWWAR